jgi:hypothetical protein
MIKKLCEKLAPEERDVCRPLSGPNYTQAPEERNVADIPLLRSFRSEINELELQTFRPSRGFSKQLLKTFGQD